MKAQQTSFEQQKQFESVVGRIVQQHALPDPAQGKTGVEGNNRSIVIQGNNNVIQVAEKPSAPKPSAPEPPPKFPVYRIVMGGIALIMVGGCIALYGEPTMFRWYMTLTAPFYAI